jgi:polar amino acid transport system substrate-binding protein
MSIGTKRSAPVFGRQSIFRVVILIALCVIAGVVSGSARTYAAEPAKDVFIPSFWEPALHLDKPDLGGMKIIRFLTDDDYPPMNFQSEDGKLAGFNVDLARALCEALNLACTVQARRWDTLLDALKEGRGDAVIASLRVTPQLRSQFAFTTPYLRTPARFVGTAGSRLEPSAETLAGKKIAVVEGSSHEVFLRTFFPKANVLALPDMGAVRTALIDKQVDALFADGLTMAVWLNSAEAGDCCAFLGGPYLESRFFGEGVAIALRPGETVLRRALDYALQRVAEKGTYGELYLRYFPVGFY